MLSKFLSGHEDVICQSISSFAMRGQLGRLRKESLRQLNWGSGWIFKLLAICYRHILWQEEKGHGRPARRGIKRRAVADNHCLVGRGGFFFLRCGSGCCLPGWCLMLRPLVGRGGDGLEWCPRYSVFPWRCDVSGISDGRAVGHRRRLFLHSGWWWSDFTGT